MPTNDERREVAARLRKKHSERHGTFEPQSISIQAMNRMDDLLDCLPKRRDMLLDLADLIEPEPEPTCDWEWVHSGPFFDIFKCRKCLYEFYEPRCVHGYSDLVANYCPNCGARVLR